MFPPHNGSVTHPLKKRGMKIKIVVKKFLDTSLQVVSLKVEFFDTKQSGKLKVSSTFTGGDKLFPSFAFFQECSEYFFIKFPLTLLIWKRIALTVIFTVSFIFIFSSRYTIKSRYSSPFFLNISTYTSSISLWSNELVKKFQLFKIVIWLIICFVNMACRLAAWGVYF